MLVPPRNGSRSMSRTEAPVRAAAIAAVEPADPAPDDADVHVGDDRESRGHAGGSAVVEMTDQPPSTASDWPVTARDSSDRK